MEGSNIAEITDTQYTQQVPKLYLLANMIVAKTLKKSHLISSRSSCSFALFPARAISNFPLSSIQNKCK